MNKYIKKLIQFLQKNRGELSEFLFYISLGLFFVFFHNYIYFIFGVGHSALYANTGANSDGVDHSALQSNAGANTDGFGYRALYANTGASSSSGFGYRALYANTGASSSSGFGYNSLQSNTGANSSSNYWIFSNISVCVIIILLAWYIRGRIRHHKKT